MTGTRRADGARAAAAVVTAALVVRAAGRRERGALLVG